MRTKISLSPGVTFATSGNPQRIIPTISTIGDLSSRIAWIELRTVDNLQLAFDYGEVSFSDSLTQKIFIINNGTENFSGAKILTKKSFVLLKNSGELGTEGSGRKIFSAWLGIPILNNKPTIIHYP